MTAFVLWFLGSRSHFQLSMVVTIDVFHGVLSSFSRIMVVGTENRRAVDGIKLSAAELCFISFWVVEGFVLVVSKLAFVTLFAFFLWGARD